MIQHHILRTNIIRIVWQTVRRLTNDILEVKGFKRPCLCFFFPIYLYFLIITNYLCFSQCHVLFQSLCMVWQMEKVTLKNYVELKLIVDVFLNRRNFPRFLA